MDRQDDSIGAATAPTDFAQSFDGREWARAFMAALTAKPSLATDEGTLVAWFCNAIMRGYDEHAWKYPSDRLVNAVGRFDYAKEHGLESSLELVTLLAAALEFARPHVDKDGIALDVLQASRMVDAVAGSVAEGTPVPSRTNAVNP